MNDAMAWSSKLQPTAAGLNPLAVAAFAVAMFVGVLAPVACAMGVAAQAQIRSSGQAGAGLARAAIWISIVYLALGSVVAGLYVFTTVVP